MDYSKIYKQLIKKRKEKQIKKGYKENHHILPKSLGGNDSKENLVTLTGREHWIAHLLLHKIHRCSQTAHACHMMAMRCEERGIPQIKNSRMYEWVRKQCIKSWSNNGKKRVGEKNGAYGTMWISNIELKENKKIKKDEEIPDGWIKGRDKWIITNKKYTTYKKICLECSNIFLTIRKHQIYCCVKCSKIDKPITKSLKYNWDITKCKTEALKYNTRTEFHKNSQSAYNYARENKILDIICEHMINSTKPKPKPKPTKTYKKWTKEECRLEAIKYNTRTNFQKECNSAYTFARRRKWLDDICGHMIIHKKWVNRKRI